MPESLADYYRRLPDERLLQIALHEAAGLSPEGMAALRAEVEHRGIAPSVLAAAEAQTRTLSSEEADLLVAAIQGRPCPSCGSGGRPLNGGRIADAKSLLFITMQDEHTAVACPDCLTKQARRAAIKTAALGWWAFPFGPIHTVRAIYRDIKTIRAAGQEGPSAALRAFVREHRGVAVALAAGKPL